MKDFLYNERKKHGTPDFPFELYHVDKAYYQYVMPYHWHVECELIRILSGSLTLSLNETKFTANTGDLVWINSGVLHAGAPVDCVYECLVFELNPLVKACSGFSSHLEHLLAQTLFITPDLPKDAVLAERSGTIFALMNTREKGYRLRVFGALCDFLGRIFELGSYRTDHSESAAANKSIRLYKDIFTFLETHYTQPLTLAAMARQAGMSPKYFCRFFRSLTGRTPIDYLNAYRISQACTLLAAFSHTVTETAFACGFNDLSYFIRTFKKYKGITPKQYLLQLSA